MMRYIKTIKGQLTILLLTLLGLFCIAIGIIFYQNQQIKSDYKVMDEITIVQKNIYELRGNFFLNQLQVVEAVMNLDNRYTGKPDVAILNYLNNNSPGSLDSLFSSRLHKFGGDTLSAGVDSIRLVLVELQRVQEKLAVELANQTDTSNMALAKNEVALQYKDEFKRISKLFFRVYFKKMWVPVNLAKDEVSKKLNESTDLVLKTIIIFSVLFILVITVMGSLVLKNFKNSLKIPLDVITTLSEGKLPEQQKVTLNEFGAVIEASNKLSLALKEASFFADEIGKGNFDHSYSALSEHDILGNSLQRMKDDLKVYHEKEKIQHWTNEGVAKFSELLRNSNMKTEEMGNLLISNMVKYLNANQGAIFLYNEDANTLEMSACYAYGRTKYQNKTINIGEGLIGQCYLENEITYLKEIPQNYITITSGLGEATPTSLLIVPLKNENKTEGVMEIASFKDFEKYQIEFCEKVGQSIALVIETIKRNNLTQTLLSNFKEQSEQLSAQEEEIRQNIEELEATQEELKRREKDYIVKIEDLLKENEELKSKTGLI